MSANWVLGNLVGQTPTKPSFRDLGGLVWGQEGEAGGVGVRESRTGPPRLCSRLAFVLAAGYMGRQRGSLMAKVKVSWCPSRSVCLCYQEEEAGQLQPYLKPWAQDPALPTRG